MSNLDRILDFFFILLKLGLSQSFIAAMQFLLKLGYSSLKIIYLQKLPFLQALCIILVMRCIKNLPQVL